MISPKNFINVMYTNACSLVNKMTELKLIVQSSNFDVICISETHFNSDLADAEFKLSGYTEFRSDRDFRLDCSANSGEISDCGGSIIYVHNDIVVVNSLKGPDSVAVSLEFDLGNVLIACVYRSPSLNAT